jgi:hypothetical protein
MNAEFNLEIDVDFESQDFNKPQKPKPSNSSNDEISMKQNVTWKSENEKLNTGMGPADAPNKFSLPQDGDEQPQPRPQRPVAIPLFSWSYWQTFTNIDTRQLYDRVLSTANPIKPVFKLVVDKNPDLYGPFWVTTFLIFLLAVSGNLGELLWNIFINFDVEQPNYDFTNIGWAVTVVYSAWILFGVLYWVMSAVLLPNKIG